MTHALENNRNVARIMLDTIRAKYTFPHSSFLIRLRSVQVKKHSARRTIVNSSVRAQDMRPQLNIVASLLSVLHFQRKSSEEVF